MRSTPPPPPSAVHSAHRSAASCADRIKPRGQATLVFAVSAWVTVVVHWPARRVHQHRDELQPVHLVCYGKYVCALMWLVLRGSLCISTAVAAGQQLLVSRVTLVYPHGSARAYSEYSST